MGSCSMPALATSPGSGAPSAPVGILSLSTALPPHSISQSEAVAVARELLSVGFPGFDRLARVFGTAGIARRYLARPVDWYRTAHDWPARNRAFLKVALDLFEDAASHALDEAGLDAAAVDTIVTVSSTGIATPTLEAHAMRRMGFREGVARIPVFGLGCAGGVAGLAIAAKLARASPGSTVLLVVVELCSLAFRTTELSKADIVSTALFGDGAAASVLRCGAQGFASITGSAERTWPDTLDIMGWRVDQDGLGVIFNRAIPDFVQRHLRGAMEAMLAEQGLAPADVNRFICHPGGAKVIEAIEQAFGLATGTLREEREVLADYGNMSAPTALFVLERIRQSGMPPLSVITALGPGFTASTVTLRGIS